MQTTLAEFVKSREEKGELEAILRSCVHCGFCNATCPTYLLSGNELEGPRGRIYLLKQMLEGEPVGKATQQHLDHCLSCGACETTCPSGVNYGRLLDLGREMVDEQVPLSFFRQIIRGLMLGIFPYKRRFNGLLVFARVFRFCLPATLKNRVRPKKSVKPWPQRLHDRRVLVLPGCVQPALSPEIDVAAAHVLDKLGISLIAVDDSPCCGALNYHLSAHEKAKQLARNNIDVCWPYLEDGVEAIIMTSSGCGVMLKDYASLLQYESEYAEKARLFSNKVKDISEILVREDLAVFDGENKRIAFQSPCTLQHGLKLNGVVEGILQRCAYVLVPVRDGHLCCGSAGVYSLLQPAISAQLKHNKLGALQQQQPSLIATSNIGCLMHLQDAAELEVMHWLVLLDGE